jgi:hypothetical protein
MTNTSKRTFETALERVRGSFRLCVYGYVVMPEHIHLLIGRPGGPLKPGFGLRGKLRSDSTNLDKPTSLHSVATVVVQCS